MITESKSYWRPFSPPHRLHPKKPNLVWSFSTGMSLDVSQSRAARPLHPQTNRLAIKMHRKDSDGRTKWRICFAFVQLHASRLIKRNNEFGLCLLSSPRTPSYDSAPSAESPSPSDCWWIMRYSSAQQQHPAASYHYLIPLYALLKTLHLEGGSACCPNASQSSDTISKISSFLFSFFFS